MISLWFPSGYKAGLNGRIGRKCGFHFHGLDSDASHLQLIIEAAEKFHGAIESVTATVPRKIENVLIVASKWIPDEALLVFFSIVEVAQRSKRGANCNLADLTDAARPKVPRQHQDLSLRERPADRLNSGRRRVGHGVVSLHHRGLCGPVQVDDLTGASDFGPPVPD